MNDDATPSSCTPSSCTPSSCTPSSCTTAAASAEPAPPVRNRPGVPARVLGGLATGTVLQPINSTMIAIGAVAVAAQFGSAGAVSWVISAMYTATAVCAPLAGRFGAVFGARRVFLAGLLLVAAGSLIGTFAPSIGWLIVAYTLVGAGIAAHMPNAMTILRVYAERHHLDTGDATAVLLACSQTTAALGPTLGGLLIGAFGWHSILWINLPVVVVSAIAILAIDVGDVGDKTAAAGGLLRTVRAFDLLGVLLFIASLTPTIFFLISLRSEPAWWSAAVATAALTLFVLVELRSDDPFLDVRALRANRPLRATLIRTLILFTCFYCVFFGIPQWLQTARGMSASEAGLTMLPVAAMSGVMTFVGAAVYRRFGARATLFIGSFAFFVGGLLLALVERSTTPLAVILIVAAVLGIPQGFNILGNQNLVNASTSPDEVGAATGMYRTMIFIGANLAVAVLTLTAGHEFDDAGMQRTGWLIAAVTGVLMVGVLFSRNMNPSPPAEPVPLDRPSDH
ncbi:MAG: MFS transporter [Gordonia sp. (in: high G+C Gram-positive bacteria)]|uniref:MFS transporter n=1 Tax=Gordonia sp. (in: high G+C Gram-positive bacteria) TaxID=84139 RepID=UPI0039E23F61